MSYFKVTTTLLTTGADDPSLGSAWVIIKVSGHQHQWLTLWLGPGNSHILEVDSIVVTWWIVAFMCCMLPDKFIAFDQDIPLQIKRIWSCGWFCGMCKTTVISVHVENIAHAFYIWQRKSQLLPCLPFAYQDLIGVEIFMTTHVVQVFISCIKILFQRYIIYYNIRSWMIVSNIYLV